MMANCIRCNKSFRLFENEPSMPDGALMVTTSGNYGSTVFDSMSRWLRFYVCDDCIIERAAVVELVEKVYRPTEYNARPWNPQEDDE